MPEPRAFFRIHFEKTSTEGGTAKLFPKSRHMLVVDSVLRRLPLLRGGGSCRIRTASPVHAGSRVFDLAEELKHAAERREGARVVCGQVRKRIAEPLARETPSGSEFGRSRLEDGFRYAFLHGRLSSGTGRDLVDLRVFTRLWHGSVRPSVVQMQDISSQSGFLVPAPTPTQHPTRLESHHSRLATGPFCCTLPRFAFRL